MQKASRDRGIEGKIKARRCEGMKEAHGLAPGSSWASDQLRRCPAFALRASGWGDITRRDGPGCAVPSGCESDTSRPHRAARRQTPPETAASAHDPPRAGAPTPATPATCRLATWHSYLMPLFEAVASILSTAAGKPTRSLRRENASLTGRPDYILYTVWPAF